MPRPTALLALLLVPSLLPSSVRALEAFDGRLALHGYYRQELRWLSDGWDANNWYLSQWAHTLNLELEADLAPDGFGPFDIVSLFARGEARFECVYTGCGIAGSHRYFGDRASRVPARNWADAKTSGYVGTLPVRQDTRRPIHGGTTDLLTLGASPLLRPLIDIGAPNFDNTIEPVIDDLFAFKKYDGSFDHTNFQMGPWRPESHIRPLATLRGKPNVTSTLPLRPSIPDAGPSAGLGLARGLYVPSAPLRERLDDFDSFDQNFSQSELQWNRGASQDEAELKELYLEFELFESRLWVRAGKQNIVWGKTELFRTTDQFNPQDLALASLPGLEESRVALWSVRGVWSFYDVGPLSDVRLELAVNFDDIEPIDLGRCGEPYTVWLVCGKTFGLWGHGILGIGLAGETRPPDPWDDARGVEIGARLEWRWERFSFALSDYYGYSDTPTLDAFHYYERRVDPTTGRPLDVYGRSLTSGRAVDSTPLNRQLFDVACSATLGVAAALLAELENSCLFDLVNAATPLGGLPFPLSPANAIGLVLGGTAFGNTVLEAFTTGQVSLAAPPRLTLLTPDPRDGSSSNLFGLGVSAFLSDEQEALLGCGPFYRTDCDEDGIDLLNAEASVLLQAFPFMEEDPPIATRFVDGKVVILPGARGPGDRGYDRRIDGTPPTGFRTELEAVSLNFARLLAGLSIANGDSDCDFDQLVECDTLALLFAVTGTQRPEARAAGNGRFGRRDFLWSSGGEALLRYQKRNVLGFSLDFAEDRTKSNWSVESTWIHDETFGSDTARRGFLEGDAFNLTISADRPTFVNFLNAQRTFFVNAQLFLRWLPDYNESYTVEGPVSALFTIAVATGYFQDRLLPSLVWVHDVRSASGGVIFSTTYRFSQDLSVTVGAPIFYGGPQEARVPLHQLAVANNGLDYTYRRSYQGLSAISERDEVFVQLRYTF